MHINPYEHDESPEDESEHLFPCACGDDSCKGDNRDDQNRRFGKEWFAADCRQLQHHPEIVRERELASRNDVYRDDMNSRRR